MKFSFFLLAAVTVSCLLSVSAAAATTNRPAPFLSPTMKKHYATLNAEDTDDISIIKQKHRRLALKYHPDRNTAHSSEEKMQEINHAFDSVTIFLSGGGEPSAECQEILNILRTWWEKIPKKERDDFGVKMNAYFNSEHRQSDMSILFGAAYEKFMQVQGVVILLGIILVFLLSLGVLALFVIIFKLLRFIIRSIYRVIKFIFSLLFGVVGFVTGTGSSEGSRRVDSKKKN